MIRRGLQGLSARRGDIWLLTARWATPFFSLLGGFVSARFLAPTEFGVVHTVLLIPAYAGFLHFGVFNGLNRNLPLYRATGELDRMQACVDASAKTARLVGAAGAIIGLAAAAAFYFAADDPTYWHVAIFLVPGLFFAPFSLHMETIYRGMRHFSKLGQVVHLRNVLLFLCSVSTAILGVFGLALKIGLQGLIGFAGLRIRPPLQDHRGSSARDIRELAVVGFPMLISGVLFSWLVVADKTVISTFLGAEELGYFALAAMAMNALQIFPSSINQLLYPRVAQAFGSAGSSRALERYFWIGLGLNFILLLPIVLLGWLLVPFIVTRFLPAYTPGIETARITLLGSIFFVYSGPSVIIPIVRRNLPFQAATGIAIVLVWIGGIAALKSGYGIEGVALARVAATAFLCCFVILYARHLVLADIPVS